MTQFAAQVLIDPDDGPFVALFIDGAFWIGFNSETTRSVAEGLVLKADAVDVLRAAGPPYPDPELLRQ
jgi:hypothetical protein